MQSIVLQSRMGNAVTPGESVMKKPKHQCIDKGITDVLGYKSRGQNMEQEEA